MICPSCGTANLPGSETCQRCELSMTTIDGPSAVDHVEGSLMSDPVAVLKPKPPVTIRDNQTLDEAVAVMMSHGVGALLVVNPAGQLIGVLTERDFLTKMVDDHDNQTVREFMTANPETVNPDDPLAFAVRKMDIGGYRHLPVIENGLPVGVVSVRDVLRHLMKLCRDHA
jgi:CBS domain-containing protein